MRPKVYRVRRWIIALLTVGLVTLFVAQLMKIQIVDAAKYQDMLNARYLSTQTIKPVRGEIVDRDGHLLAGNRMGYDIQIDRPTFPSRRVEQNEVLQRLTHLFEALGEEWNDNLPLTTYAPYSFVEGQEARIETLKEKLKLQSYSTAENVMDALVEKYRLSDYSRSDARKLAGICYEMEQRDFSNEIPYTFASDLDILSVIQIRERSYELPGVDVVETAMRIYEDGDLAPHIIGTIGKIYAEEYQALREQGKIFSITTEPFDTTGYFMDDVIGKEGVELAFEEQLRGHTGRKDIYTDSSSVISVEETISPIPGNTVMLTIDRDLQKLVDDALQAQIKYLQDHEPEGRGKEADTGAAVVLNVKTGEVMAAITYPSYDLATYRQDFAELARDEDNLHPLLNRAVFGEYVPGSIFKPTVALAGLENEKISATSTFVCNHTLRYNNQNFTCLGTHGAINVGRALHYSCNIFFYETGLAVGIDGVNDIAKQLGLGEPTGIEIPEAAGQRSEPDLKEPLFGEPWYPGDVLQSSIGQMLNKYTPLQLANYAATIANRGTRMKATIVREIRDYSMQEVIQPFQPQVAHQMDVDPAYFETVIDGMVSASHYGTASGYFGNYPIRVASKTGTPETGASLNSTFIAFAPADDPEVAVAVIIENGWHGYTGAPVAKAVFDTWFGVEGVNSAWPNGWDQLRNQRALEAAAGASSEAGPGVESEEASGDDDVNLASGDGESASGGMEESDASVADTGV